jgi:hypothetical protein
MTLLSDSELAAIRAVGELGMTADVQIYAQTMDTGLDSDDDAYGSTVSFSTTPTEVKGWLVGNWSPVRSEAVGDIDTTTTYVLRLPVGTAIEPGDKVVVGSGEYSVADAGTDATWPEWLVCMVRRSK